VTVPAAAPSAEPVLPVAAGRVEEAAGTGTGEHRIVDVPPPPEARDDVTEVLARRRDVERPRHRGSAAGDDRGGAGTRRPAAPRAPGRPRSPAPPVVADPATSARPPAPPPGDAPKAEGYLCARGHLNDPRAHFCLLCGIRMNELDGALVVDVRPPLGVLVFDDGTTHPVDTGYLLGREPDGDARVRSGVLRPIVLDDPSGSMSRVHAEIRLENWDVMLGDSGSSNGTFVAEPGTTAWSMLPPARPQRLVPGTRVRLGRRTFTFETPSGVR
jgi:hypothetical protein